MKIAYLENLEELVNSLAAKFKSSFVIKSVLDSAVSTHNTSSISHEDIRSLISTLTNRLNALADSDDETLDQLSEIVAYIKSNKDLIESVTTSKVSVSDIIDSLNSTATDKPLAANQGQMLKDLIDELQSSVEEDIENLKKSVSDGKAEVANAITDKGVDTATDAAFATMAENIGQIETGTDTSDANAVPMHVLNSEIFYGKNGREIGTMPLYAATFYTLPVNGTYYIPEGYHTGDGYVKQNINTKGAQTYTPTTTDQKISSGQYLNGEQTIKGDVNLIPTNIAAGKSIFGVSGTLPTINNQAKTVTPTASAQTVKPDSGYTGLSQVSVNAMKLQTKTIGPTTHSFQNGFVVAPDAGYSGLSEVTVNAMKLQSKTVSPSASAQTVAPDSGFYGLSQVTVNAQQDTTPSSVTITGNLQVYLHRGTGTNSGTTNKSFNISIGLPISSDMDLVSGLSGYLSISTSNAGSYAGAAKVTITGISLNSAASISMISEHMGVDLETAQQMYNAKNVLFEFEEDEAEISKVQKVSEAITKNEKLVSQSEKLVSGVHDAAISDLGEAVSGLAEEGEQQ